MENNYLNNKYPKNTVLKGKVIDILPFGYIIEIFDEQGIKIDDKQIVPLALVHKGQYFYNLQVGSTIKGIVCGYQNWLVHITDVTLDF